MGTDPATAAVAGLFAAGGMPAAADPVPAGRPMGDPEVEQRLAELDELLGRVEDIPGPAGTLAMEAVAALAEIYGAALTRAVAYVSAASVSAASVSAASVSAASVSAASVSEMTGATEVPLIDAFTGDDLLGHLLALHGIHPDPAEQRIARALDTVQAELGASGGEVSFLGIGEGVAEIRISSGGGGGCGSGCGCSSSSEALADTVRDAVLAAAPELSDVRLVVTEATRSTTFIPLDSLMRAPAGHGAPG